MTNKTIKIREMTQEEIMQIAKLREKALVPPKLQYGGDLVETYNLFRDRVYNPKSVLYSSCGIDASPSRVFDNVTFVDLDEESIKVMQKEGLRAINCNIKQYRPQEAHDLVIIMNPATPTDWITPHLVSGGYVLANDYHSSASDLFSKKGLFNLVAAIKWPNIKTGSSASIETNIEDFFKPVKNLDELKTLDPSRYALLERFVKHFFVGSSLKSTGDLEKDYVTYREELREGKGMPSKRIADLYAFKKL